METARLGRRHAAFPPTGGQPTRNKFAMAEGDQPEKEAAPVKKVEEGSWMDEIWAVGFVLAVVLAFGASWYLHR